MRIRGFFDTARFDEPYIMANVKVPELGIEETVKFLVDTGSPNILIYDADAENLGIDVEDLPLEEDSAIGAGGAFPRYVLKNAFLIFRTEDGEQHVEHFDKVYVVKQEADYAYNKEEDKYRMPSLLGRNFLNKYLMIYKRSDETLIITDKKVVIQENANDRKGE